MTRDTVDDADAEAGVAVRPTLDDVSTGSGGAEGPEPDEAATTEMPTAEAETTETATAEMPPREVPAASPPARGGRVWILLAALLMAAVAGPLVFWLGFWRYDATAQHHIPGGTVLAVRIDARELYLFGPFREHLLPAFAPPSDDALTPTTLQRIRTHTGVDLTGDVREILLATTDGARWAVLLGGRFQTSVRRAPFLDGFQQAMGPDGGPFIWQRDGEVLVGPGGAALAQAEDGTLLFTSSADVARAALPATDDYRELWLSSAGDLSFSIDRPALTAIAARGRGAIPELAVLDRAQRITGWVKLDDHESELAVDVLPVPGEPIEPFTAGVEALVRALAARLAAPAGTAPGEGRAVVALGAAVLGKAKVQARADSVLVTSVASGEHMDAAFRELAPMVAAGVGR